ncbi:MAG: BREX-1 system adenine-specific DNA-methyltransferase PglX [Ruminococcus sp.]|nr:BREX-1 system adenine-specific DNA-methyltransferase PglX [Ruminococcus sp.]
MAYWVGEAFVRDFIVGDRLCKVCETKKGLATSDNNRFLKLWFEVCLDSIGFNVKSNSETVNNGYKWYPHHKGGEYRRWYGNQEYVINWKSDGYEIKNYRDASGKLLSRPQNTQYNFSKALTWSKITSSIFSARFSENRFLFDDAAAICYHKNEDELLWTLGFLNSKCCQNILNVLNLTINIQIGDIGNLPILHDETRKDIVTNIVEENIALSKTDWDSFETSWDFNGCPLI